MKTAQTITSAAFMSLVLLLPGAPRDARAQDLRNGDVVWGARGGYSRLIGYWQRELADAPYGGLFQDFFIRDRVMAETDLTYASYPLEKSSSSKIYSVALAAGPLWHYPLFTYARVYGGLSVQGVFFSFNSDEYGKRDYTFKPGGMLKAGVFIPAWKSVMLRAGAEYSVAPLSGRAFGGLNFIAGASYNYYAFARAVAAEGGAGKEDDERTAVLKKLYDDSVKSFRDGDIAAAKAGFAEIDRQSAFYRDVRNYLALVARAESSLEEGTRLFGAAQYYEAVPHLDDAAKYSAGARELLKKARERLAAEIPALEQMGVAAYERGEYEQCIILMKKIQLADPENRVMAIYLPRAQKRYEGLQKLR